jgi:hypothetical protein
MEKYLETWLTSDGSSYGADTTILFISSSRAELVSLPVLIRRESWHDFTLLIKGFKLKAEFRKFKLDLLDVIELVNGGNINPLKALAPQISANET